MRMRIEIDNNKFFVFITTQEQEIKKMKMMKKNQ